MPAVQTIQKILLKQKLTGHTTTKHIASKRRRKLIGVGFIFEDFGCFSINSTCGANMILRPFLHFHNITDSRWHEKCVHRCSCINDEYMEKNKQCVKQMVPTANSPKMVNVLQMKIVFF